MVAGLAKYLVPVGVSEFLHFLQLVIWQQRKMAMQAEDSQLDNCKIKDVMPFNLTNYSTKIKKIVSNWTA